MIVLKGKHGGFCFGVKRAVSEAEKLFGEGNYVLGEIIHNEAITTKLERQGIKVVNSLDDVEFSRGDNLLIRTHGEVKATFETAKEKGLNVIDCTCPFVKDIQKIVEEHYRNGYTIAIIGKAEHPEIIGINGWCNGEAIITEDSEVLSNLEYDKLCVVVQTTYSEEKFDKIIKNFTYSKAKTVDIFKTICYTTIKRQRESEILSANCDAVIVLGGANSNNTDKLFETSLDNLFQEEQKNYKYLL